jgi:hypothetical protein
MHDGVAAAKLFSEAPVFGGVLSERIPGDFGIPVGLVAYQAPDAITPLV